MHVRSALGGPGGHGRGREGVVVVGGGQGRWTSGLQVWGANRDARKGERGSEARPYSLFKQKGALPWCKRAMIAG